MEAVYDEVAVLRELLAIAVDKAAEAINLLCAQIVANAHTPLGKQLEQVFDPDFRQSDCPMFLSMYYRYFGGWIPGKKQAPR